MIQSWDYFKMRCSCLYYLFTEPKLKKDKEAGNLSETAKKFLYEVYLEEKYGIVEQDVDTPEIRKGRMVEGKIVDILSMVDDEPYEKNMEQKENEWISGEADIVNAGIDEIKAPWSMATLIPHLRSDIPDIYFYQNQGYQYLWGKWKGRINWVVVDCPAELYIEEQKRLYYRSGVIWDQDPKYLASLAQLERQLIVEHYIPLEERMIRKEIARDETIISAIPAKVNKAREFLWEISMLHKKTPQRVITADEIILKKL